MLPIFCFRCSQISISVDGICCFYCDNDDSRRTENFQPPMPEPGNVSSEYHVPATHTSTQTFEDFTLPEPTREASTQTTDSDFNFLAQTVGYRGRENGTKINGSSQLKTLQNFDNDFNANQNLIPANPSTNEDDSDHLSDKEACNSATIGPLLEPKDDPHAERSYHCAQSSIGEFKNNPNFDRMPRGQGDKESIERVNEVGKLDFAGSILFQSGEENNRQEKGHTPPILVSLSRRSSSDISKRFPETLRTAKAVAEQKAHSFRDVSGKKLFARCEKCGSKFFKESLFIAHMQNNCERKCGKCGLKFAKECHLVEHQWVHTGDKPFKCTMCDYAAARACHLNTHLKKHTKK